MKKKNNTVEFWRFIMTFGVVAAHVNRYYRDKITTIFAGDGTVMVLFLCLTGYFLMQGFQSKKEKGISKGKSASEQANSYLGTRLIRLYPVLLISVLLCFVLRSWILNETPIAEWPALLMNSTFEIFGMSVTGINWAGDAAMWFPAGWYISGVIIAGYFVYYLLAKHEETFTSFIAPLSCMFIWSWDVLNTNNGRWFNGVFDIGIYALFRCYAGICLGVIVWRIVKALKGYKYSKGVKVGLTIFNALLMVFLLVNICGTKCNFNYYIIGFWLVIETIISLLQQDYISKVLDNKVFGYLGSLTLYMYGGHRAWAYIIPNKFADLSYYQVMGMVVGATLITALLMKVLVEKVIVPCIEKVIEKVKKAKIKEA